MHLLGHLLIVAWLLRGNSTVKPATCYFTPLILTIQHNISLWLNSPEHFVVVVHSISVLLSFFVFVLFCYRHSSILNGFGSHIFPRNQQKEEISRVEHAIFLVGPQSLPSSNNWNEREMIEIEPSFSSI